MKGHALQRGSKRKVYQNASGGMEAFLCYTVPYYSILFCSVLIHAESLCSFLCCSLLFCSTRLCSILLSSVFNLHYTKDYIETI